MMGILLLAMIAGAVASVTCLVLQFPLWAVLLAYPGIGSIVLLLGLVLAGLMRWFTTDPTGPGHLPVARSTTPAVANRILKSVANDKLRS